MIVVEGSKYLYCCRILKADPFKSVSLSGSCLIYRHQHHQRTLRLLQQIYTQGMTLELLPGVPPCQSTRSVKCLPFTINTHITYVILTMCEYPCVVLRNSCQRREKERPVRQAVSTNARVTKASFGNAIIRMSERRISWQFILDPRIISNYEQQTGSWIQRKREQEEQGFAEAILL